MVTGKGHFTVLCTLRHPVRSELANKFIFFCSRHRGRTLEKKGISQRCYYRRFYLLFDEISGRHEDFGT